MSKELPFTDLGERIEFRWFNVERAKGKQWSDQEYDIKMYLSMMKLLRDLKDPLCLVLHDDSYVLIIPGSKIVIKNVNNRGEEEVTQMSYEEFLGEYREELDTELTLTLIEWMDDQDKKPYRTSNPMWDFIDSKRAEHTEDKELAGYDNSDYAFIYLLPGHFGIVIEALLWVIYNSHLDDEHQEGLVQSLEEIMEIFDR